MCSGDRDEPVVTRQQVQRLRAVQHGDRTLASSEQLGVVGPERTGHDDGVSVRQPLAVVPDPDISSGCPKLLQGVRVRAVGAAHRHAGGEHHVRDARHAAAADADEVHASDSFGNRCREVWLDHLITRSMRLHMRSAPSRTPAAALAAAIRSTASPSASSGMSSARIQSDVKSASATSTAPPASS